MSNKYISIINSENIFWVKLKPTMDFVEKLNNIIETIGTDYSENIFSPDEETSKKIKKYSDFIGRSYSHEKKFNTYAMSIFNEDSISFIILKDSKVYDKLFELVNKEILNK